MLELLIWSLFVGSLGIDAVLVSGWLRWQEKAIQTQEKEEEEILSTHETQDHLTGEKLPAVVNRKSPRSVSGAELRSNRSANSSVPNPSGNQSDRPYPSNRSVNSLVPNPSGNQSDRAYPQPVGQKIPGKQDRSPDFRHSETGLNPYPPTRSHLASSTLTHSQTAVNGLYSSEIVSQPMYITEPKITEWEYKIVRAHGNLFRHPTNFIRLCEEEAQAGWIMLEKLDDHRVRFKRSRELRDQIDVNQLSFDPYRCHYGPSHGVINFLGAIAALTAMVLPAYLGYTLVSHTLQESTNKNSQTQVPLELIEPTFQPPQIP